MFIGIILLPEIFLLAYYTHSFVDCCLIALMPVTESQEAEEDGEASIQ
jgi:hypothetical protein